MRSGADDESTHTRHVRDVGRSRAPRASRERARAAAGAARGVRHIRTSAVKQPNHLCSIARVRKRGGDADGANSSSRVAAPTEHGLPVRVCLCVRVRVRV